ncbi:hypothetical protein [Mesoflavibacter sp. CH_XMU1404-2]|uniref:hypothetical protein n=1 Tax=Mesoflavibacter sp. CH_XMU1404-2 TaxID=3107766 RepID=UPI00300A911E
MKYNEQFSYIILVLFFINCKPVQPFKSIKEERKSMVLVNKELDISKNQLRQIKKEDSVLFLLSKSLKNSVKPERLERRLDSFYQKRYTKKELLVMLELEYIFRNDKNPNIELDRSKKPKQGIDITNVDDGSKFLDSLIEKNVKLNVKNKDSLN